MRADHRLGPQHLARKAVVYLRQSSEGQVRFNRESQRLQYDLARRARELGFRDVEVIDTDLGSSAGSGAPKREGFQRLLAAVALREVGLVLAREVSRLSRNDKDFCHLIELCQLFDTLIGDGDAIYNPRSVDDQLVLGIKGTLSVAELGIMRLRLVEGQNSKARRGELVRMLPGGYVLDADGKIAMDPNKRARDAIKLIFEKFRSTATIRQTFKWFHDNHVEVPVNAHRGGVLGTCFRVPTHSFISAVLHNPIYAGAYAYGRRPMETTYDDGVVRRRQGKCVPLEQTRVLLRDHHEGYISWQQFEEHQRTMRNNALKYEPDASAGAARTGQGLLVGLMRCGRCGRKFHVRYWGKAGTAARYMCLGTFPLGGEYCQGFGGSTVDRRFGEEILRLISPLGVRASVQAAEQLHARTDGHAQALAQQAQQQEYEAQRAFEQYNAVDARNRLVAEELERRWNAKLQEVEQTRKMLEALQSSRPALSAEDETRLHKLGADFSAVWNSPACPSDLKKRITRTLIEEVVADETASGRLRFIVHWKGGVHTSFEMDKPRSAVGRTTSTEDLEIIRTMAARYGDDEIARVLSKLGRLTGKGRPWSSTAVHTARRTHDIAGHVRPPPRAGILSLNAAARHLGVSDLTIKKLVGAGVVANKQLAPWAPWEILQADLEAPRVGAIIGKLKATGRLEIGGMPTPGQRELFDVKSRS